MSAWDPDEGANGDVWYRMVNASTGPFIIAHDTGIISTRVPLDREKVGGSQYQVSSITPENVNKRNYDIILRQISLYFSLKVVLSNLEFTSLFPSEKAKPVVDEVQ